MRYLFFLLCLLCTSLAGHGQVAEPAMGWLKTFGGNRSDGIATTVCPTYDGGFIIVLGSNSTTGPVTDSFCNDFGNRSVFIKYDSSGTNKEWDKCFKGSWGDTAITYIIDASDSIEVLFGYIGSGNLWTIRKVNKQSHFIYWQKAFGGSSSQIMNGVAATDDGGYILSGYSYSNNGDIGFHYGSSFDGDFWVLKLDSNGNKLWSKVIGGTGDETGGYIYKTTSGGYYLVGSTNSTDFDCIGNHGGYDVYIARLDSTGSVTWHKCIGGSGGDGANLACYDNKGGIVLAASTSSTDGDVYHRLSGGNNIWVIDIDSSGTIVWSNCYGGGGSEYPNSICKARDGSYWLAGQCNNAGLQFNTVYGRGDGFFMHIDTVGRHLSTKVLGSSQPDEALMVYPLPGNSVVGGGYFSLNENTFLLNSYWGFDDAFLVTFNSTTTSITPISSNEKFDISPNPFFDKLQLRAVYNKITKTSIYNENGRLIYETTETDEVINTSQWPQGIYYIRQTTENSSEFVKVVKL